MMNTSNISNNQQPKRAKFIPLWQAYPLALFVWGVLPWAISLLTPRHGWVAGRPRVWNLLGLIPVLAGAAGIVRGMLEHSAQSQQGIEWELDRSYLLSGGLYTYSRNPMYLAELTLMSGWVIFYGSLAVLIAFIAWALFFNYRIVPMEERILEAHFGEKYLEYKSRVPRWFGKVRR